MLTFVIPVRHPDNSKNWPQLKRLLGQTVAAISRQDNPNWRAVIVANAGSDLPALPAGFEVKSVDFPPNQKHDFGKDGVDKEAVLDAFRYDKGRRVLAGMLHARDSDYFMIVDDDDFVSRRLAGFVSAHHGTPGWFIKQGYVWADGGAGVYLHKNFHKFCGTSHIVRADLLELPARFEDATTAYIKDRLGSHVQIDGILHERGTPLVPLPFSGAVYRIGHPGAHSKSASLLQTFVFDKYVITRPWLMVRNLLRMRSLTPALRHESSNRPARRSERFRPRRAAEERGSAVGLRRPRRALERDVVGPLALQFAIEPPPEPLQALGERRLIVQVDGVRDGRRAVALEHRKRVQRIVGEAEPPVAAGHPVHRRVDDGRLAHQRARRLARQQVGLATEHEAFDAQQMGVVGDELVAHDVEVDRLRREQVDRVDVVRREVGLGQDADDLPVDDDIVLEDDELVGAGFEEGDPGREVAGIRADLARFQGPAEMGDGQLLVVLEWLLREPQRGEERPRNARQARVVREGLTSGSGLGKADDTDEGACRHTDSSARS